MLFGQKTMILIEAYRSQEGQNKRKTLVPLCLYNSFFRLFPLSLEATYLPNCFAQMMTSLLGKDNDVHMGCKWPDSPQEEKLLFYCEKL